VLVSWAVPKGIPLDPKKNHLAVHVEDHPLDYIDFEGEIPAGEYGAGQVKIFDRGTYEAEKFRDDEVIVTLHGERVRGKYALFQTRGDDWMIHRMDPPPEGREPMPEHLVPMLAKLGKLPREEDAYGYEIKWDGVRTVLYGDGGRIRLESRNLKDITPRYPEVTRLGRELGARQVVLDGEVVAFDEQGRPSFGRLQERMHLASEAAVRRRMKTVPVAYMAFDLLFLNGHSTMDLAYTERRALLEELDLNGPAWRTPDYHRGEGRALLEASKEQGLEGIVAKRLDSHYEPGRRTGAWIKVKNQRSQELVVGGWMPGQGSRQGTFGALLVGYYDKTRAEAERSGEPQRLIYAGRVGTGFKQADLDRLLSLLEPLRTDASPFEGRQPPKGAIFVEPRLVAEVEFLEWTHARTLRAPSFKGLRDDKDPRDVVVEEPG
jgi:bifunctional non-homologous end joining protein LigD